MKGPPSILLGSLLLICHAFTSLSWAGQVVTDATKSWAKRTLQQEETINSQPAFNTLAVLYFHNKTGLSELDLLEKGLAIVLMTDLSQVETIQLVERVKVQALVEELGLGTSGIVDSETKPRVGRLLGAAHLVGGDIAKQKLDQFKLEATLLKAQTGTIFGEPEAEGRLIEDFFRMEKDLLFGIIKELRIELTPKKKTELQRRFTNSLQALRHFVEGIEHSDRGDYEKARESYSKALKEDPNLSIAEQAVQEIKSILPEGYSTPNSSLRKKVSSKSCRGKRNKFLRGMRR
jgi:TolB-like protein